MQFTEVLIPGASSTKPAARILIIPNRHTRTHTWAHLSLQPPQARRYQLFFAVLVLVFTAEYSLRFLLLLCFCLGGVLRHPQIHHSPRSSSLAHARAPLRIKTKPRSPAACFSEQPRSRTVLGSSAELSNVVPRASRSTATKKKKRKEKALHARASTAIDESRLIGRYCLKGLRRPLPCAGPPPPCQKKKFKHKK